MKCIYCKHDILNGQLYIREKLRIHYHGSDEIVTRDVGPVHVACPTERQVRQALLWGRWS